MYIYVTGGLFLTFVLFYIRLNCDVKSYYLLIGVSSRRIIQLSTLQECDMTNCLPEKECHPGVWPRVAKIFEGKQSVISHSYKVDNCFITSNILHSAIIFRSRSNLTTDTK